VAALEASRALHREVAAWQSALVAEALAAGATWEEIGAALGITRQAAWARFRRVAEGMEGGPRAMDERVEALTTRVSEEMKAFGARLRALDEAWRRDRERLQGELRDAAQRASRDRRALQQEMRETGRGLRREVRRLRHEPPDGEDERSA
jgi:hypothetical protein